MPAGTGHNLLLRFVMSYSIRQRFRRPLTRRLCGVGINIRRRAGLAMPQVLGDGFDRDTSFKHDRRRSMAQAMQI